jgi:hypothetical protein
MSIIQEALKKAQTKYIKEVVKTASAQENGVAPLLPQNPTHAAIPFAKLAPGVILLILIIGFGLNSFLSKGPIEARKNMSRQDVSYKPAVKDAAFPIKSAISSGAAFIQAPNLELNGIMYLQERPRAIINGDMLEAGEFISGARVNAITKDSVLLNYNDTEITLKLKE